MHRTGDVTVKAEASGPSSVGSATKGHHQWLRHAGSHQECGEAFPIQAPSEGPVRAPSGGRSEAMKLRHKASKERRLRSRLLCGTQRSRTKLDPCCYVCPPNEAYKNPCCSSRLRPSIIPSNMKLSTLFVLLSLAIAASANPALEVRGGGRASGVGCRADWECQSKTCCEW